MRSLLPLVILALCAGEQCDVLIAGGSLASLAAALTAADTNSALAVCFLEVTDWPGGQLTASAVPAVDFGPHNRLPANLPASFRELVFGPLMPNNTNPGRCWVSTKCFEPQRLLSAVIEPMLRARSNLKLFLRTAVTAVERGSDGRIIAVTGVQRGPAMGTTGWEDVSSAHLEDWYSPTSSVRFPQKAVLQFRLRPGGVVVEATEFGDVLAAARVPFAQGAEAPAELSSTYLSACGQSITVPFYIAYHAKPQGPDTVPPGSFGGLPFNLFLCRRRITQTSTAGHNLSWAKSWTYRRSRTSGNSWSEAFPGDVSNQNLEGGNDYAAGYVFLPLESPELQEQLQPGRWRGGVNLTALTQAEQRSFGFYHFVKKSCTLGGAECEKLRLSLAEAGTGHGLAKMPYLRDSRRPIGGLDGFRLTYADLATPDPADPRSAKRWADTVALGEYLYADVHRLDGRVCSYPAYLPTGNAPTLPYYIPLRALTVDRERNLLVTGKSMAQSFWANAATRLHPEEWSTGAAAGATAALMALHQWSSQEALANVGLVQEVLTSLGIPLRWTFPPPDVDLTMVA